MKKSEVRTMIRNLVKEVKSNSTVVGVLDNVDLTKPVKLKKPVNKKEAKIIFKITNCNRKTKRVYIEPISGIKLMHFKPQELVSIKDIENI